MFAFANRTSFIRANESTLLSVQYFSSEYTVSVDLHPKPARRLNARKRAAILKAAADQFLACGYEATSMDSIAATAQVSKRTVYKHFVSKDMLFAETLIQLFDSTSAANVVSYQPGKPLRTQLVELLRLKASTMADRGFLDLSRVAIGEAIRGPDHARALFARLGEREAGVCSWIRSAQEDGKLKECDPQLAAMLLQGPVKAVAFWPQVLMGAPTLPPAMQFELVDTAVDMFLGKFSL